MTKLTPKALPQQVAEMGYEGGCHNQEEVDAAKQEVARLEARCFLLGTFAVYTVVTWRTPTEPARHPTETLVKRDIVVALCHSIGFVNTSQRLLLLLSLSHLCAHAPPHAVVILGA